jgi:4-carboxymuconolactone decarboxylase
MSVLEMNPSKLSPAAQSLYAQISAKRKARGEGFGGPYVALLNHPELARRVEDLGFYLKFEGVLPRPIYQFIVLSVAHATGATYEWHDHVQHALAAGLSPALVDGIAVAQWGREGLVEIVVVSGFYQMFAAINQGFDIHSPA